MKSMTKKYLSALRSRRSWLHILRVIGSSLPVLILLFNSYSTPSVSAHSNQSTSTCTLPQQPAPNSNSLLVVLLDRSGSLVDPRAPTDPLLYSSSVTKALADVWPGKMAVVAFNTIVPPGQDEQVQLHILGPLQVGSDETGRDELKNEIQALPNPTNGTPTGPAMNKALEIIRQEQAPLSKVVLITDGSPGYHSKDSTQNDPDGSKEEAYIRGSLLSQFCDASIPVDTIGLKTDANANQFLSDIASGTGGQAQSVQDPGDLANAVLGLYGQWQQNRVAFRPLQLQADNLYHIPITPLVRSVNFFVFRAGQTITLSDPNHHSLQPVELSSDQHYVYDRLDLLPPRSDGDYTISLGNNPQAQVYIFLTSSLNVRIDSPNATTQSVINQPLHIQARLLNGQQILSPLESGAALRATIVFTTAGQHPRVEQIDLQQQGGQNLFTGQTSSTYPQAGQIEIIVVANYGGMRAETDINTSISCGFAIGCIVQQDATGILISSPFALLVLLALIAWLIWRQQPAPFGSLRTPPPPQRRRRRDDDDDEGAIVTLPDVEAAHPWSQRLFRRSLVTSNEIQTHPDAKGNLHFDLAGFDLMFKKDRVVELKSTAMEPIFIKHNDEHSCGDQIEKLELGESVQLRDGDVIQVDQKDRAIFAKH